MVKTLGVAVVAAALTFGVSAAYAAEDFKKIENTVRVETKGIGVDMQANINNADRVFGIDYTLKGITGRYERAEGATDASDENRISLGYDRTWIQRGPIAVSAGVTAQYRMPDDSASDRWFKISPVVKVTMYPMRSVDAEGKASDGKIAVYGQAQPNVAYDKAGVTDFTEIVDTNWKAGVDYSVTKNLTAGVYVQTDTDKDWNRTSTFVGTGLKIKF